MPEIVYTKTDATEIVMIKPLWEKLLKYHREISPAYFIRRFEGLNFDDRMQGLLKKYAKATIRVDLAKDAKTAELIGYCVSAVSAEGYGEIESIFVEPDYRRCGIADTLMKRALQWMDGKSVKRKTLAVSIGNEEVIKLYERYGFYPRSIILEQVEDDTGSDA
jgi:ribosomal protein S18 acetylase RimI-like enzyme